MKKKAFTMVEILIAAIIVAILASLSIASYQYVTSVNKARICAQKQQTIDAAIDIYTLEEGKLPASLAKLTDRQIYLAYQNVTAKENRLFSLIRNILGIKPAVAQPLSKYYGRDPNLLRCTADTTHPGIPNLNDPNTFSYAINPIFAGQNATALTDFNTNAIIYDKASWHKEGVFGTPFAIGTTPTGIVGKIIIVSGKHKLKKLEDCFYNIDNTTSLDCDSFYGKCEELCEHTKEGPPRTHGHFEDD